MRFADPYASSDDGGGGGTGKPKKQAVAGAKAGVLKKASALKAKPGKKDDGHDTDSLFGSSSDDPDLEFRSAASYFG